MSNFQIIVIGVFIFLAIVGVVLFAGFGGINNTSTPTATVWGTLPADQIGNLVRDINASANVINVKYVQKDPATFDSDFVNAVAEGTGPDIVIISDRMLYKEKNKLVPIGFNTFPLRQFQDTFVDEANAFVGPSGIYAVPLEIDPMVMYWNKDILSSAGVATPPKMWTDLSVIGPSIIHKTDASTLQQELVPFGEYRNVTNAKQILASLLFQAGNPITAFDSDTGQTYSALDQNTTNSLVAPAEAVLNFYNDFSNPLKPLYTWNRALPNSQDAFLSGNLALYFGFASELTSLRTKNPNLNFDVTVIPQNDATHKATYGQLYGLGIVKGSKDLTGDLTIVSKMTDSAPLAFWTSITNLPPVRKDLLSTTPTSTAYMSVFYEAAVQSKTWSDPDPQQTDQIFQNMVESITTGQSKVTDAITTARGEIDNLLKGQ